MNRSRRFKLPMIGKGLALLAVAALSFQVTSTAFAATGFTDLGASVVPHSFTAGRPGSFKANLYFDEGSATTYRLFDVSDNYITWDTGNANQINTVAEDYAMAWHIFRANSNCFESNVGAALDGNHNPIAGTWWGTNLPNMPLSNIFAKTAGCNQGSGPWNEVRFNVRYHGQGSTISANTSYYAEATFRDSNYPSRRAWVELNYNFIHDYGFTHDDIYYENTSVGNKICVNSSNVLSRGYSCP